MKNNTHDSSVFARYINEHLDIFDFNQRGMSEKDYQYAVHEARETAKSAIVAVDESHSLRLLDMFSSSQRIVADALKQELEEMGKTESEVRQALFHWLYFAWTFETYYDVFEDGWDGYTPDDGFDMF